MTRISTNMFHYHKDTRKFSQEASTLGPIFYVMFNRLFPDACDEGFELVSQRTGKVVKMYLADVEIDNERETLAWHFQPYQHDSFFELIVWND